MPIPRTIARLNRYVANPVLRRIARVAPGFGIVHHIGRTSGRIYTTPVNVFRENEDYVIALTYGSQSDWAKNVLVAGGCDLETRGRTVHLVNPVLEIDRRKDWAPLPVKLVLRIIGVNDVLRLRAA